MGDGVWAAAGEGHPRVDQLAPDLLGGGQLQRLPLPDAFGSPRAVAVVGGSYAGRLAMADQRSTANPRLGIRMLSQGWYSGGSPARLDQLTQVSLPVSHLHHLTGQQITATP